MSSWNAEIIGQAGGGKNWLPVLIRYAHFEADYYLPKRTLRE